MYEIWIKKGILEYKLDDTIHMDLTSVNQMVQYLMNTEEFKSYEIIIRTNNNLN